MTIYILSQDSAETKKWLDDRSLDKQIKDVAKVLCDSHHICEINVPLRPSSKRQDIQFWVQWACKCQANYLWLVNLLDHILWEQIFRFGRLPFKGRYHDIFKWARDNVPDLPVLNDDDIETPRLVYGQQRDGSMQWPPLVMPNKYIYFNRININSKFDEKKQIVESYRKYYQSNCQSRHKNKRQCDTTNIYWTLRQKPKWLNLEI